MGNKHLAAAESALRQHTLPNAPKLKFLDAVDLWHKAGKCFAIACEWEDSAHAFNRAATFMLKNNLPHESAVFCFKAAEMLKRIDPMGSVERYESATKIYVELKRFFTAGNITVGVAELLEEQGNMPRAIDAYSRAAEFYQAEYYHTQSCRCLYKVAELTAMLEKFDDATWAFEAVAESMLEDNLLRLNVNSVFLRAGLCQLANAGPINEGLYAHRLLRAYMRRWAKMSFAFECSRERLLLDKLIGAIGKCDLAAFADHLFNFNNVQPFGSWHLRLLRRCLEDMEEEQERVAEIKAAHEAELARIEQERLDSFKSEYKRKGDDDQEEEEGEEGSGEEEDSDG